MMQPFEESEISKQEVFLNSVVSTAKVAGIAAIISLLGTITGVIVFLMTPTSAPAVEKEGFDETAGQVVNSASTISVFFSLIIGIIAFYYLYRFSILTKKSLKNDNHPKLAAALYSLAGYFKIWGVIMFVVILFFVLALIGGIVGAAFQ